MIIILMHYELLSLSLGPVCNLAGAAGGRCGEERSEAKTTEGSTETTISPYQH